jgi:hypothetical protein
MAEQLTERYCVSVNGHAVEPGCWVDGHWGQYGPDHLADRAEELGWEVRHAGDDPRRIRRIIEWLEARLPAEPFCKICRDRVEWIADRDNPPYRKAIHEGWGATHDPEPVWPTGNLWEYHSESGDAIERWLNEHTETEGYSWGWHDGEFYLWPTETWEEGD